MKYLAKKAALLYGSYVIPTKAGIYAAPPSSCGLTYSTGQFLKKLSMSSPRKRGSRLKNLNFKDFLLYHFFQGKTFKKL
ncbi:hypothetical protein MC5_00590 [Rickettsia australis str. Cutlack]|uniref:Uncharacterized protein n=1 Tax=Rickettsia australis (strain Cutlack) TaxID=1105110 RepID=H8K915_RICAC|nr:hypothetical protein MC5_00590 [Rickettsia australis str. Cutlack]